MTVYIAPVVEGQTEVGCVERLLQRVWHELFAGPGRLHVLSPSRGNRDALVSPNGLDLTSKLAEARSKLAQRLKRDQPSRGLLLLLLDAEGDCPATLAPRLLSTAHQALPADVPVSCVLAKRMLENWIVAGASSLAGVNGLPDPLPARDRFEDRNGAAWLEDQLRSRNPVRKYKKTVDAAVYFRAMDLRECRANSPSFDKLCRELEALIPQPSTEAQPSPPSDATDAELPGP
jgi:hypothetical protein